MNTFVSSVPQMIYSGEDSYKCEVSVSDLSYAFGPNWHICHYSNSMTMWRIYGLVSMHFRKKVLKLESLRTIR